jgi:RHS repeat-associated protein
MMIYTKKNAVLFVLFLLLVTANGFASKRYWRGNNSNKNWNVTSNWSATSGGTTGASVPVTTDTAYFNGSGTGQCSINATISINRLEMASTYTDTLKQNTFAITIGTGGMVLSGGKFWGGTATILNQGIFTLSGNTFRSTSARLTIQKDYTVTSGSFIHNNGEVFFTGIFTIKGISSFYKCTFYPLTGVGATFTLDASANLTVNNLFTHTGCILNGNTINVKGDVLQNGTNTNAFGTTTLLINGTGNQTITGQTTLTVHGELCNVKIDKVSGILYLKDYIVVHGKWEYISGTVDATTYNSTLSFPSASGNITNSIIGKQTLNHLLLSTYGGVANNLTITDTLTLAGGITTQSTGIVSFSGYIKLKGDLTINNTNNSSLGGGTATIQLMGTSNQTITGATAILNGRLPNISINKNSGTVILKSYITIAPNRNWKLIKGTLDATTYASTTVFSKGASSIEGKQTFHHLLFTAEAIATTITIPTTDTIKTTGELRIEGTAAVGINGGIMVALGDVTVTNTSSGLTASTGTIQLSGTGNQTLTGCGVSLAGRLGNVTINKPSGTLTLSSIITLLGKWKYSQGIVNAGTSTVVAYSGTGSELNAQGNNSTMSFNNVSIAGTATTLLTGNIAIGNKLAIGSTATLNGNGKTINIGGDWDNTGSFTFANTQVICNGTADQRIIKPSGTVNFHLLNVNKASGKVRLNAPVSINNTLTLTKGVLVTTTTNIIQVLDNVKSGVGNDSSYVSGPFQKIGNDDFTFPLGDTLLAFGAYHPLSINAPSNSTDVLNAQYFAKEVSAIYPNYTAIQTDSLENISNCEFYTLTTTASQPNIIPSIGWNSNSCISDIKSDIMVISWDGTQWKSMGRGAVSSSEKKGIASAILGISISPMIITFGTAKVRPAPIFPCTNDINRNWISSKTFDGNGNVIAESRAYSDYMGRATQSQTRVISANNVLATQTIYDAYGRAVLQTLPAPINQSYFCYKDGFITNATGTDYNYTDFDIPNYTHSSSSTFIGEVDKPKNVSNTSMGTLGWYYSDNNTLEPYVATSGLPYTRTEQDDNSGGVVIKSASAGSFLSMGSGHEAYTFSMPTAGELKYLYGFANGWEIESAFEIIDEPDFAEGHVISNYQPEIKAIKTISIDQNGIEMVSISDFEGKALATCLSGSVNGSNVQVQHVTSVIKPGAKGEDYVDIHLPLGCENSLILSNLTECTSCSVPLNVTYNIFNLKTGKYVLFSGSIDFTGTTPNLAPGYYRIFLKSGGTVSELYAKYNLNYYNFSINYYDKAGRLKMTIPPEGIDLAYNPAITNVNNSSTKFFKYVATPTGTDPNWSLSAVSPFNNQVSAAIVLPISPEVQVTNIKAVLSRNPALVHATAISGVRSMSVDYLSSTPSPQSLDIGADFGITDPPTPPLGSSTVVNNYEVTFDVKNQVGAIIASGLKVTCQHYFVYAEIVGLTSDGWLFGSPQSAVVYPIPSNTTSQVIAVITNVRKTRYVVGGIDLGIQPIDNDLDDLKFSIFTQTEKLPGIPIHKMPVVYDYNSNNLLLSDHTVDEGKTEYVYENDGRVRFSQNTKQRAYNANPWYRKFSYSNYDASKRIIEAGEFTPLTTPSASNVFFDNYYDYVPTATYVGTQSVHKVIENSIAIDPARCSDRHLISYDFPDANFYTTTGLSPLSYKQEFMLYKVSKTENNNKTTWYSYDELGRVKWMVQRIENMPSTGSYKIATVNYLYDAIGNITQVQYNKEVVAERFYHYYTFDADNRLYKVFTNTDGSSIQQEEATYYYYLHGPLKRIEIANKAQGLDYVYTINGWLKSLNTPELNERDPGKDGTNASLHHVPKDLFAFTLDYFGGDYLRSNTNIQTYDDPSKPTLTSNLYNGSVKDFRWQTQTPSVTSGLSYTNAQLMYAYKYDQKNQLTDATFGAITLAGTLNAVPSGTAAHDYYGPQVNNGIDYLVNGITYDLQGNLKTLNRNAYAGGGAVTMDQMAYNYIPLTNKLSQVTDAIIPNTYSNFNFKSGQLTNNYVYDQLGQLLDDNSENNYYTYNVAGKVTEVYSNSSRTVLKAKFAYDENGQRLKKTTYDVTGVVAKETWYVCDAAGNELSIYEKAVGSAVEQVETAIFTSSRIGIYNPQTGKRTYEIADHLGNVHTTFGLQPDYSLATNFNGAGEDDYLFNFNASIDPTFYKGTSGASSKVESENPIGASITIPVTTAQVVTANVYSYYAFTGLLANAQLVFELKNNAGVIVNSQSNSIVLIANSWQLLTAMYTVPTVTSGYQLTVYTRWQGSNPQPVWFDDLSISLTPNAENIGVLKLEQLSVTDYYPHGGIMPGRNYAGATNYRYGYQGQFAEKDAETGFNNFELRMWDGKLGRWLNPDPKNQYHSPYMGMGNNPVSSTDPDGGYSPGEFDVYYNYSEHQYNKSQYIGNRGGWDINYTHYYGGPNGGLTKTTFTNNGVYYWGGYHSKAMEAENAYRAYGGDGSGSFGDMWCFYDHKYNPISSLADGIDGLFFGTDHLGNSTTGIQTATNLAIGITFMASGYEAPAALPALEKITFGYAGEGGFINLASSSRTTHIIAGDATGGGHAWFGSLKSFTNGLTGQKSMFPITWSKSKIMHAASDVIMNNPITRQTGSLGSLYEKSGRLAKFTTFGEYQGVKIKVVWSNLDIITSHPIY